MAISTKKPSTKNNQPKGVNGLSVTGFVLSLCGFFTGITFIVGLILSAVGMSQTKKTGQEGRGMALAGVIIGAIGTGIMLIVGIIVAIVIAVAIGSDVTKDSINKVEDCSYNYSYNTTTHKYEYKLICN